MFANQLKLSSAVVYRAAYLLLAGSYTLALLTPRRNATIACQLKVVPPWSTAPQQGAHVTRDSGGGLFRRQTPYLSVPIRTHPYRPACTQVAVRIGDSHKPRKRRTPPATLVAVRRHILQLLRPEVCPAAVGVMIVR